jgi:hypothetical protein
MNFNKKLLEAKPSGPEVKEFIERTTKEFHPFVDRWVKNFEKSLKEGEVEIGELRGQTVADAVSAAGGMQVYATLEIFNAVIRGFTRYMDDSFVRKYVTDSVIFKIPLTEYRELVGDISAGQLPHTEKMIDYATVNLSTPESERGGKVTWTRSLLEDVTFDVQAEMAEGLGHAIAYKMMADILTELLADDAVGMPLGAKKTISNPITWAEFLDVVGSVDSGVTTKKVVMTSSTNCVPADIGKIVEKIVSAVHTSLGIVVAYDNSEHSITYNGTVDSEAGTIAIIASHLHSGAGTGAGTYASKSTLTGKRTYGPADFCLVSPDVYWQLLNIIQMTNVLYEGSTDPVKKGVIKLALGCSIVKQSLLPTGTMIALNSEKAIGLVTRRALKIEPVLFPVWNEYGFIGTVRYGVTDIYPGAIQLGATW